jgi:hypothetical protein
MSGLFATEPLTQARTTSASNGRINQSLVAFSGEAFLFRLNGRVSKVMMASI